VLPPIFTNSSHYLPPSVRSILKGMKDTAAVVTSAHLVVIYSQTCFRYEAQRSFSKGVIYLISTNRGSLYNAYPIYFSLSMLLL